MPLKPLIDKLTYQSVNVKAAPLNCLVKDNTVSCSQFLGKMSGHRNIAPARWLSGHLYDRVEHWNKVIKYVKHVIRQVGISILIQPNLTILAKYFLLPLRNSLLNIHLISAHLEPGYAAK
jgi:hypothetical protein